MYYLSDINTIEFKASKGFSRKVAYVLNEAKAGKLHSGSKAGKKVRNKKQALAIALSVAKKEYGK
jgi:hypothetical protein